MVDASWDGFLCATNASTKTVPPRLRRKPCNQGFGETCVAKTSTKTMPPMLQRSLGTQPIVAEYLYGSSLI